MRNRLLIPALMLLLGPALSHGEQALVSFGGNYKLQGDLISMNDDGLILKHEGSDKPVTIARDKVISIAIFEEPDNPFQFEDIIQLMPGTTNAIPCRIIEINKNNVVFDCPYTSQAKLSRNDVLSVSLNTRQVRNLWSLPFKFDRSWWVPEDGEKEDDIKDGLTPLAPKKTAAGTAYDIGPRPVTLSKRIGLNLLSFDFSTTVRFTKPEDDENFTPQFSFIFSTHYNDVPQTEFPVSLLFIDHKWILRARPNMPALGEYEVDNPFEPMKINLSARTREGSRDTFYELKVNGKPVISQSVNTSNLAREGSFGIRTRNETAVRIENPMLSNILPFNNKGSLPFHSGNSDSIETTEDESLPGSLISYSASDKSAMFMVENDQEAIKIPSEYIEAIIFKNAGQENHKTAPAFEPCTILMKNGTSWKGTSPTISNGQLHITHYLLGRMGIPLPMISRIELFAHTAPTKSTP